MVTKEAVGTKRRKRRTQRKEKGLFGLNGNTPNVVTGTVVIIGLIGAIFNQVTGFNGIDNKISMSNIQRESQVKELKINDLNNQQKIDRLISLQEKMVQLQQENLTLFKQQNAILSQFEEKVKEVKLNEKNTR